MTDLQLHPDRLLPPDGSIRPIARRLYEIVRELPVVSPHGHVDPAMLLANEPFADPTSLLVQPDHYVTRLLHANGVALDELGVGEPPMPEERARQAWRLLCANWHVFQGTPVRYWFDTELVDIFGIPERPSAETADRIYDQISECLAGDEFRPLALFRRFRIDVLATTDDPCDPLDAHAALAADSSFSGRVLPTFRPDKYLEPGRPDWSELVDRLGASADVHVDRYDAYRDALAARRAHFVRRGAVSADHSHADNVVEQLPLPEARRLFDRARSGSASAADTTALRRHFMFDMAAMSCDDGLVMTLHPAISRNHHQPTLQRFGPDSGHDLPVATEFTTSLQPMLHEFGTNPNFRVVLFTVDADVFNREIAPLAGFYPSVFIGVPWWFLDNPGAIRSFQRQVTEIAGLSKLSGFIDDTRAFCSIPARHDMSRRLDAGFLAGLVAEHRLDEDEAAAAIVRLVDEQPRKVFNL